MLRRAALVFVVVAAIGAGISAPRADLVGGLQGLGAKMAAIAKAFGQQTGAALGGIAGQTFGSLTDSLLQSLLSSGNLLKNLGGNYLEPTPGTASLEDYVQYQGLARRYVAIFPTHPAPGAPVLILLHAHGVTPERMANLTRAGRLAATEGAYVLLPEAESRHWNDDPSASRSVDDVGFISALIDKAVNDYHVDQTRIYAAGYSNGGFMAERLACELAPRIAGIAAVAASLRVSLAGVCAPARQVPVLLVLGTSDPVVWYQGNLLFKSAAESAAYWASANGCGGAMSAAQLPNLVNNATQVALTQFTACPAGTGVAVYTINKGGHTWPGSQDGAYTAELGRTSKNLDATTALWRFLIPFSRSN